MYRYPQVPNQQTLGDLWVASSRENFYDCRTLKLSLVLA
jgi:hypothetical protein